MGTNDEGIIKDYFIHENYQCGIYKKRGLAASVSTGDTAGNCFQSLL
jgi:hypothetical protein